ncbi:MAG TPA: hypothetical protein VGI10_31315 [Polyangiaceae bacterium]|jgi:archaemetzincin
MALGLAATAERSASAQTRSSSGPATPPEQGPITDSAATAHTLVVHLIPLGTISPETVEQTARGLREHAPVTVAIEARQPLPASAESSEKKRYRAERILGWLPRLAIGPGKLLAVTDVDIVTRKGQAPNWGILGLGAIDGRACLLSTFRMKRAWEKGGAPEALVRQRLWKTSVHELGHTLGLEHCPNRGCIMEDGHGTVRTSDRESALCPSCARRFAAAIAAQ